MLISFKTMLDVANKNNFAVASPNVYNLETVECAFQAARELNAPVILMVWDEGPEWISKVGNICKDLEKRYPDVVASVILDHGGSYKSETAALKANYNGVMVDRSSLSFDENVRQVKAIVDPAHAMNIAVEAEIGHVGEGLEYESTRESGLTDPKEALEFVKQTGIDCVAVSVGTSHGMYKGEPKIDFDLLDELKKELNIPLVLHGGSGTGDENLTKAVEHGINKVNLCSDLMYAMEMAIRDDAKAKDEANFKENNAYFEYFMGIRQAGHDAWKDCLKHYMKLTKAEGKADLYKEYRASGDPEYYEGWDPTLANRK